MARCCEEDVRSANVNVTAEMRTAFVPTIAALARLFEVVVRVAILIFMGE